MTILLLTSMDGTLAMCFEEVGPDDGLVPDKRLLRSCLSLSSYPPFTGKRTFECNEAAESIEDGKKGKVSVCMCLLTNVPLLPYSPPWTAARAHSPQGGHIESFAGAVVTLAEAPWDIP